MITKKLLNLHLLTMVFLATVNLAIAQQSNPSRPPDPAAQQQAPANSFKAPDNIEFRTAKIISEGVRLNAEIFSLKTLAGKPLPTIIMAHGWGGTAANFRWDALQLANAGYLVVTFDYRGWGQSDGRIVLTALPEKRDGRRYTAQVEELREYVDPIEQTTDWFNVINWAMGEPMIDKNRLGLRGSSYSGGHVFYVAARDPRVKAIVSQVGAFDSRWVVTGETETKTTRDEATKRARGEIAYPEPRAKVVGNLIGAPIRDKLLHYVPVDEAAKVTNCAALFIVAEKEELFDNKDHAKAAYDRMPGKNKKYVSLPGITHYGVYTQFREPAIKMAIEWFDEYLKNDAPEKSSVDFLRRLAAPCRRRLIHRHVKRTTFSHTKRRKPDGYKETLDSFHLHTCRLPASASRATDQSRRRL
jgi:pimeloyl-ACP methyl ester carboxylesterase